MSYSAFPQTMMYPGLGEYTEADYAKQVQLLHMYAASIADSKQRYAQTHDPRYIQSVQTMIPYFQSALQKAQAINSALSGQDMPSSFSTFLADSLGWIADAVALAGTTAKKVVTAAGDTVEKIPKGIENILSLPVLVLIAGAAFLYFGGSKYLPKRKA